MCQVRALLRCAHDPIPALRCQSETTILLWFHFGNIRWSEYATGYAFTHTGSLHEDLKQYVEPPSIEMIPPLLRDE